MPYIPLVIKKEEKKGRPRERKTVDLLQDRDLGNVGLALPITLAWPTLRSPTQKFLQQISFAFGSLSHRPGESPQFLCIFTLLGNMLFTIIRWTFFFMNLHILYKCVG